MAPRTEIRFKNTTIEAADGYWCLLILRYRIIFQLGMAEAGGVRIRFFTENTQTDIVDLSILVISLYVVIIAISRRRRRG